MARDRQLLDRFNLRWDQRAILLPNEITIIKQINDDPLLNKLKADIARWNSNPFLSFIQRIESIKMNILPRILFLFQALPVEIT